MSELIRSSEFGDWLLGEISRTRLQSKSAPADRAPAASARLESLQVAKQVLREFLTLQEAMLHAASEAREQRASRRPPNGRHLGLVRCAANSA